MPPHHPLIVPPEKPQVLIVGAGIGGLTLGILLEKAHVPYEIFDRMAEIKPLGSALMLGSNVAPLFQQLGIYDEFLTLSKVCHSVNTFNEDREMELSMALEPVVEISVLYDLLRRQIPEERIHLSKRVLSTKQNEYGVQLHFSDGSVAEGDILVGADGAYSAVRQSLYKQIKKEGNLPCSDDSALPFSCVCLVGQTKPMDPVEYPRLGDQECYFNYVIGREKPYSANSESSKDNDSFRNSEWGPEAAEAMCKDVRDFPAPGGKNNDLKMGELIDQTPLVSKVMLEEKVFSTWHYGRTVLLGDACHKIHPASGSGAVNAIHDAVCLANWISVLKSTEIEEAEKIFKEYRAERYPAAMASFASGQSLSKLRAASWKAMVARFVTRNMPLWLYKLTLKNLVAHRPQVSFLPLVEDKGALEVKPQSSLEKTLAIKESRGTVKATMV
ncbi:hypothetical protein EDD11_008641 [Mortierella claussenii]|nr:hypothetical protein EDD11_008641 [Mortierella claussenii]